MKSEEAGFSTSAVHSCFKRPVYKRRDTEVSVESEKPIDILFTVLAFEMHFDFGYVEPPKALQCFLRDFK
uniref:Cyclin N-terminal domain-containing protein n=1 Tax=Ascaris lumbricoides TaxID=6252 RepID=A0A0M3HYC3_ASCLU